MPRKNKTNNRGSTLVAALALAFLILAVTTLSLARVAASYSQITIRHNSAKALFLADAGIQKAAHRLARSASYVGEKGAKLPTGYFDVKVSANGGGYVVTSTGYANSPLSKRPHRTVRAIVTAGGGRFRITDWRENP